MLEDVDEVLETMRIEEEPPIDDKIQPIETLAQFESATVFKGYEALHIIVLDIDDQLLCYDVQRKLDRCMMNCNDHLRHFNDMLTH